MWTETVKVDYGNEGIGGKVRTIFVTYPLTTNSTRMSVTNWWKHSLKNGSTDSGCVGISLFCKGIVIGDAPKVLDNCMVPESMQFTMYIRTNTLCSCRCRDGGLLRQSFSWPESFSLPFFKKQGTPEYQFGLPGKISNRFEFTNSSSLQANWRWMLLEFDFRWPSTFNQLTGRHSGKM